MTADRRLPQAEEIDRGQAAAAGRREVTADRRLPQAEPGCTI